MTGRTMTDAQLSVALRAHLPAHAQAGLHDRITAEVARTRQARRLPWIFGLGDADPVARRRAILALAVLALVATLSVGAAVGAWLDSQKPSIELGRSREIDAFVLSSYQSFAELPPFRFELHETGPTDENATVTRYLFDGHVLREEYAGVFLLGSDFIADQRQLDGGRVWVVSTATNGHPLSRLRLWLGPDCGTGWDLVEVVDVIGRSTRHVRCMTTQREGLETIEGHLWIDIETGLPLRSVSRTTPRWLTVSDVLVGGSITEVKQLEFGPQDPALFAISGKTMSADEFACATEGTCASPASSAPQGTLQPSTAPFATPPSAPAAGEELTDLTVFVAEVIRGYQSISAVEIAIEPAVSELPFREWRADGAGSFRWVFDRDPSDASSVPWIATGGRSYEWDPVARGVWRDWGAFGPILPTFGLVAECGLGWTYLGDDLVLDRPAAHLVCGMREFWIDREWLLVTRAHSHDPLLGSDPRAGLSHVTSVTFEPQPADLFVLPPDQPIYPTH